MDNREMGRQLCIAAQPKGHTRIEHIEPTDLCPVCGVMEAYLDAAEKRGNERNAAELARLRAIERAAKRNGWSDYH